MDNYIAFHVHNDDSLLDSCTKFNDYVDKAVELGQTSIGLSNHGNCYNYIEHKLYCKEKGIKFLFGVEIYLTESLEPKVRDNFHTILIAKNFSGMQEINILIDRSTQEDHFYYKNRITFDEFLDISDNVIKTSACMASPLNNLTIENSYLIKLLKKYDYYEVQPHIKSDDQKQFNKQLYEWSKQYNKPLIAGTDTHSLNKYKAECRTILQLAKNIKYSNEDEFDLTYKSYDELIDMFDQQNCLSKNVYMEAIKNTNVMADSVEDFDIDTSFKYPKLYDNEEDVLNQRLQEKYQEKISNGAIEDNQIYHDNIAEELRVFKKIGMIGFMLFMSELMTWCRENNIPYGFCRGSVGGSTVAYILDITDVNPITWKTIFSRFANEDRIEIGDIDLDVSPSQRDLVYQHIIETFGADKTAFVLAIGTVSEKGTIDEIGRALHYKWIEQNNEAIRNKTLKETESPFYIRKIEVVKEEFAYHPEKTKEKYPEIFYYYDGLINTSISQSIHPAGIVVSPVTLTDNYGTFYNKGKRILSINMEEIHEVSLVKYDILGLKNIEIIKDTYELLNQKYPLSHEINWNDQNVWDDTVKSPVGIFQFEGAYSFQLLNKFKPQKINDLSLVNACLRPSGESYRDKLISRIPNKNPSKQIDDLLMENNGYLVFQEDTLKFLQSICGLSGSEADNVRRAIGRKDKDRLDKALPGILEGYCRVSDKPREIAEKEAKAFLQIIEDSSKYQFGYNHSTGYSMIAYLCAYLRYYHPLEFITAYLNNAQNQDDVIAGSELAILKNIEIKPIKFRHSKAKYFPDTESKYIYKGISSIKYCSDDMSEELYGLRDNEYKTFVDLLIDIEENTSIDTRQMNILIKLNFFSEFGNNQRLLNIYNEFLGGKNRYSKKLTDKSKQKRIPLLYEFENALSNEVIDIKDQIDFENNLIGSIQTTYLIDKRYLYVSSLDTKYAPRINLYCLNTGKTQTLKIQQRIFDRKPFKIGDIIYVTQFIKKPQVKMVDNKFVETKNVFQWWIDQYNIVTDFNKIIKEK